MHGSHPTLDQRSQLFGVVASSHSSKDRQTFNPVGDNFPAMLRMMVLLICGLWLGCGESLQFQNHHSTVRVHSFDQSVGAVGVGV